MARRLEGRVAIVTGASSGMGKVTAIQLASEGASVVLAAKLSGALSLVLHLGSGNHYQS